MITAQQFIALSDRDQDKVAKMLTLDEITAMLAEIKIMIASHRAEAYSAQMRREYISAGEEWTK